MDEARLRDINDAEIPPALGIQKSLDVGQNTCSRCIHIHDREEILLRNILASYKKETLGVCTHCGFKIQFDQFSACKCEDIVKTFLTSSVKQIDEDKYRPKIECETKDNSLEIRTLSNSKSNLYKTTKENIGQIISVREETSTKKSTFLRGHTALERNQIKFTCSCPGLSQQYESNANFYETFSMTDENIYDQNFRFVFPSEHKESVRHDDNSSMLLYDLRAKDNNKNELLGEQRDSDLAVENMKLSDGKRTSMGVQMTTSQNQVKTVRSQKGSSLVNLEGNRNAGDYPKLHDKLTLRDKGTTGHKPKVVQKTKLGDETRLREQAKQVDKSKLGDKGKKLTRENEMKNPVLKESADGKPTFNKKIKRTYNKSQAITTAKQFNKDYLTVLLLKAKKEKQWERELSKKKDTNFVEKRGHFISVKKGHRPPPPTKESDEISDNFSIAKCQTETTGPETTNTFLKLKMASTETFKQKGDKSDGVIRFALSDRKFIDMGWTQLPTEKVVRKLNVYRMHPSHPEFDWFTKNKGKRMMLYDSGETLAKVFDDGRGRWFYRNGNLALDYYNAEEIKAGQRYVVYSSGEPDGRGRSRPRTVLATFLIIQGMELYTTIMVQLKYNQNEGVVLDRSIGPESHWKWHSLNDPPVLQHVMIDTQTPFRDPRIQKIHYPGEPRKSKPVDNTEMVAIEFKNLIKARLMKKSDLYTPYQIKMKALKINDKFSLKILDQAKVYLIYRDGATHIKINLGLTLDNSEIVDTVTCDVDYVYNTLEEFPGRTESIAVLQRAVAQAQGAERARVRRDRRLRPPAPSACVDRLLARLSRPLHPLDTITTKLNDAVASKYATSEEFLYNIKCDNDNLTLHWLPNMS